MNDTFSVAGRKTEGCPATIMTNNVEHECHRDKGHAGAHVTRVLLIKNVYEGFEWLVIGDQVQIEMAKHIAEAFFDELTE